MPPPLITLTSFGTPIQTSWEAGGLSLGEREEGLKDSSRKRRGGRGEAAGSARQLLTQGEGEESLGV